MFARRKLCLAILAAPWLALLVAPAQAQAPAPGNPQNRGYLVDKEYRVTKNPFGLCWRTSEWTPALAAAAAACRECTPDLCPVVAQAPAPATTPAPEPAPAPPAPAPEPPPPRTINLATDTLFAFDKAELRPQGQAKLDELVSELSGADYGTIVVTGHTDRLGSERYNQRLSERRAGSVRDYLVSKGVPADRISAEGRGETQPALPPGECRGRKSPQLIACLQPDRRVEVTVSGTRPAGDSSGRPAGGTGSR